MKKERAKNTLSTFNKNPQPKDLYFREQELLYQTVQEYLYFDDFQVYESYAYGANAVLLIARFLSAARLNELAKRASSLDLESLIEIDNESKDKIFDADLNLPGIASASLLGINNRDLNTFDVNLETFEKIAPWLSRNYPLMFL